MSPDAAGLARSSRSNGVAALGRLAHGDEPLARRDDVDLLVEDPILLADADRDEEDAEDVVLVRLDPGPRLVVVARRREQALERAIVDLRGERPCELGLVGIEQVDPLGALATRRGSTPLGLDLCRLGPRRRQRGALVALLLRQPALRVECAHAAHPGGGDRLAVGVV